MFDIGFSEIFVVAVVALLVLGPERLPKAARFAGLWVRRARAQWYSVKAELENELADEDLKRTLRQTQTELREARDALAQGGATLQSGFEEAAGAADEADAPLASAAEELEAPQVETETDTSADGYHAAASQQERGSDARG